VDIDIPAFARRIATETTASDAGDVLLGQVWRRLIEAGLPLWRVSVSAPTIDPLHRSVNLNWHADRGDEIVLDPHGPERETVWRRSPIFALVERDETAGRWRLEDGADARFPLLAELRAQGATDYVLRTVGFAPGTALRGVAMSFATRRPGGFSEDEVAALDALLPVLGLAAAKLILAHTLDDVLDVYLGPMTSRRVLGGEIRRGQGRTVHAAILLADLRGFTALTDRADPLAVVGWLDEHLEALGDPVTERGGEILKFLGDGFLAVFPVAEADARPCPTCGQALDAAAAALAANDRLNARRRSAGLPELAADLALHYGAVVYGNVGTGRRLDFTMIGRAVNEASRIESFCEGLGRPLLISDTLAERCGRMLDPVGTVELRGLTGPRRLWTLPGL
jgi:adenylate cyclase